MIKFFKRIRKQLLGEGKASSYFKYALGEILLVVIGILIALQINNWNEARKERAFEIKMLTEIRNSLQQDTTYFNMLDKRLTRIDTSTIALIKIMQSSNINEENLQKHAANINHSYIFQYHNGSFESLKASGIEKVSNDSLRTALIEFYDFTLPQAKIGTDFRRSDSSFELEENLEWELFEMGITNDDPFSKELTIARKKFISSKLHSKSFYRYVKLKQNQATIGRNFMRRLTQEATDLIILITNEISDS